MKTDKKKEKIDIKYIGVPNVCFSLTDKTDDREKEFKKQRIKRGFDESETWTLTSTFAKFMLPRLKEYQKITNDYLKRSKKEIKDIDDFIKALEHIVNDPSWSFDKKTSDQVQKGLKKFHKIFLGLWW